MPSDEELAALLPVVHDRLPTLGAIGELVGFLWVDRLAIEPETLVPKRWDAATTREALAAAAETIAAVPAVVFEADELEPPLRALAEARGWKAGDLFMAIRVAVTGRTATPPLFDTLVALGRERTLERLRAAIDTLERSPATVDGTERTLTNPEDAVPRMARTILVVDDEPTLRETVVDALEADGFRVIAPPTDVRR